jgi:hypothetical protein
MRLGESVDRCRQPFATDPEDGKGAWGAVSAGILKAAGVDAQGSADPLAAWQVAVAENDAGRFGEICQDPLGDIVTRTGAVRYPKPIAAKDQMQLFREEEASGPVAHIPVDRVHFFAGEGLENRDIGEITGVDDHLAAGKGHAALSLKGGVRAVAVAVGKDPDRDDRLVSHARHYTRQRQERIEKMVAEEEAGTVGTGRKSRCRRRVWGGRMPILQLPKPLKGRYSGRLHKNFFCRSGVRPSWGCLAWCRGATTPVMSVHSTKRWR